MVMRAQACLQTQTNVDVYEKYGVRDVFGEFGLAVAPQYSGRGVGEQVLRAR